MISAEQKLAETVNLRAAGQVEAELELGSLTAARFLERLDPSRGKERLLLSGELEELYLRLLLRTGAELDSGHQGANSRILLKESSTRQSRFLLETDSEYILRFQAALMSPAAALEHLTNALGVERSVRLPSEHLDEVKFLTQNVWGIPRILGGRMPHRHKYTASYLNRSNYDVVGFQEMWSRSTKPLREMKSFPYRASGKRQSGMLRGSGLVTISKYPIIESESLSFKTSKGVERHARKGALFSRIALPSGRCIDVYNVHLISSTTLLSENAANPVRLAQLQELRSWIDQRRSEGVPVVVLGDFNIDSKTSLYGQMSDLLGNDLYGERNSEKITGVELDPERKLGYTYDPERNYWARNFWASKHCPARKRLDYIFLDGLSPLEFSVSSNIAMRNETYMNLPVSDHFGVEAHLKWYLPEPPLEAPALQENSSFGAALYR